VKGQTESQIRELHQLDTRVMTSEEVDKMTEKLLELLNQHAVLCEALAISMVSVSRGAASVCYIMV
jgi:hypothetical protein